MPFTPLTEEQYNEAIKSGYKPEDIVKFEKQRKIDESSQESNNQANDQSNPQIEKQNIIGQGFNVPGATSRAAIRSNPALAAAGPLAGLLALSGSGGQQAQQAAGQGALNPSSVQTFQDQAIQAGQNSFGGPSTSVGVNFMKGLIPSAAGMAADVATDPMQALLTLIGGQGIGKAADVAIPEFKSTGQAMKFGAENKNNIFVLDKLAKGREEISKNSKEIMKLYSEGKVSDEDYQKGFNMAVKGQLYREALEGARDAHKSNLQEVPNNLKNLFKFDSSIKQADESKGALDALMKSYGSAYDVTLKQVENVPTQVDFGKMPQKVLDIIKNRKDVYGVEFNENGSIKNTIGNVNKIKQAADEIITPAMRKEATKSEIAQVEKFAGHVSGEMRKAAKAAGKPIDEAMDAYGNFRDKYNLINDRLVDRRDNALANKMKEMFRLNAEPVVKQAWKSLSKESSDLKGIMDSRNNREILKALLKTTSIGLPVFEAGKKVVTGHF